MLRPLDISRKLAHKPKLKEDPIWIVFLWGLFLISACGSQHDDAADKLNETSYYWHYRNLDSAAVYAVKAWNASADYNSGKAEALNNLAFTQIMHLDFSRARHNLKLAISLTDNQVELFIADIQMMRICQRQSSNKEFYDYHELANRRLRRINDEKDILDQHQRRRFCYAITEYAIVTSTYYYYVGLERQSKEALLSLNGKEELTKDTAQLVNYYYNIGAGGIITDGTQREINQSEFDYLMRCYMLSLDQGYIYFVANALQALSEHLMQPANRTPLIQDNMPAIRFLNIDNMPDSLLAGNMAQRSLNLFSIYGDPYQMAGSYRTLAGCYQAIGDYRSSIVCLNNALTRDTAINRAPDLVASIREQLSVAWSAMDNKQMSDQNRNIYLDLQESTRQDRYLEARASQLESSSKVLNLWIGSVVAMIVVVVALLIVFSHLRRKASSRINHADLLQPLQQWQTEIHHYQEARAQRMQALQDDEAAAQSRLVMLKRLNIDQRAKIQFVKSMLPLVDRMKLELSRLEQDNDPESVRKSRLEYVAELSATLNQLNGTLTEWIQLRRGQLGIHVETFPLAPLFEMIKGSATSFALEGVTLKVDDTDATVKADRVLTLFMINTLADNARKFTPRGGVVEVSAATSGDLVEIAVSDTGCGIAPDKLATIFDTKALADQQVSASSQQQGHGYGLMNCKGIMEKYRKTSRLFANCQIKAESRVGQGSRFSFTLPKGIMRLLLPLLVVLMPFAKAKAADYNTKLAAQFADSAYFSNINGTYTKTVEYADSALRHLNAFMARHKGKGLRPLSMIGSVSQVPPEITWFHSGLPINYTVLLDVRNECAVAALALHDWTLYRYNNKVYTQLFREVSADNTLGNYCRTMQRAEQNKNVAVILLVLLLLAIGPAYYFIYYRHVVYFRFCVEQVASLNQLLLSTVSDQQKLQAMRRFPIDRFPSELGEVANKIINSLERWIADSNSDEAKMEAVSDSVARLDYEASRLHVQNSTTDNCLSSLKHETMYYPARISLLAAEGETHLADMAELASYYERLFVALLGQALSLLRPVGYHVANINLAGTGVSVWADKVMVDYLLSIITKANDGQTPQVEAQAEAGYVVATFTLSHFKATDTEASRMFTTEYGRPQFLICRQIVRDSGDLTRHFSCGIWAQATDGATLINVKLPGSKTNTQH